MLEIVTTLLAATIAVITVAVGLPTLCSIGRAQPQERAYLIRLAGYWSGFAAAVSGWVVLGVFAVVYLSEFWRGAYWGGTAILWFGYVPALIVTIRGSNRKQREYRILDAA